MMSQKSRTYKLELTEVKNGTMWMHWSNYHTLQNPNTLMFTVLDNVQHNMQQCPKIYNTSQLQYLPPGMRKSKLEKTFLLRWNISKPTKLTNCDVHFTSM